MFTPVNTVVGNHFFLLQTRFLLPLHSPELRMFVVIHFLVHDYFVTWDTRSLEGAWRRGARARAQIPRSAARRVPVSGWLA